MNAKTNKAQLRSAIASSVEPIGPQEAGKGGKRGNGETAKRNIGENLFPSFPLSLFHLPGHLVP
jgi:hypothetical protein